MPGASNQRKKSNASSLPGSSAAVARSTPKSSKKEGPFGNAAVTAAISGVANTPTTTTTTSDYTTSDLGGFGLVKWDNDMDFESDFLTGGHDAFAHQSELNPPTATMTTTATSPMALYDFTPESALFALADTNSFNNGQAHPVSDMGSPFTSSALPNNLFENTPLSATISNTPGPRTTDSSIMEEGTSYESTLASPEELDFRLKPRAALRHFGSVYLSGKNSGPRRSASVSKAYHSKPHSKPRSVTAGPLHVAPPALPRNIYQQQQQQKQPQSWPLLNNNPTPLLDIPPPNLPPLAKISSPSADQKSSTEWLSTIHTELKSLIQHIKISGTGRQAKLYEIAGLLVEIKKQQKRDSEVLARALQIREDQEKRGLEGFVDDSLKFLVQVLLLCFLGIGILLQYQLYSSHAERSFNKWT